VVDKISWLADAEEKDHAATHSDPSLLAPPGDLDGLIAGLRAAPYGSRCVKDVLRASRLQLLGPKHSDEVAEHFEAAHEPSTRTQACLVE
jgi:hypothetical protein